MRGYILLLTLVLSATLVIAAQPLEVTVSPDNQEIVSGENANFVATIYNNKNENVEVTIKSLDLNWILEQDLERYTITKKSNREIQLNYKPLGESRHGKYGVNFVAMTDDGRVEKFIPVNIIERKELIRIELVTEKIDPRKENIIKIIVKNNYNIPLSGLTLNFISDYLKETRVIDLKEKEILEIPYTVKLDPKLESGKYPLQIEIMRKDESITQQFFDLNIGGYTDLKELEDLTEGLFYKEVKLTKTNSGNTPVVEEFTKEFTFLEKVFTSFDTEPDDIQKSDGRYIVTWKKTIEPSGEISISYTTNYRKPVIFLLIIIVGGAGYYFMSRRSVRVSKRVVVVSKGATSTLKVTLSVSNHGESNLKYLKLMDRIPNPLKAPSSSGGVLKKEGQSYILLWEIKDLAKRREVQYSYTVEVKSRLGGMMLPPAVVKYTEGVRRVVANSNSIYV